jgi:uncharacterized protein (DUF1501 family)
LNTVVPYADPLYEKNRIALRIDRAGVVKLDDAVGLHPNLKPFVKLVGAGEAGGRARESVIRIPTGRISRRWTSGTRPSAIPERRRDGWLGRVL